MSARTRLLTALLVVGLVAGAAAGAAGDDASIQNGDHDHSDGSSDDGNFLPGPAPGLVLVAVGAAAVGLRRRG